MDRGAEGVEPSRRVPGHPFRVWSFSSTCVVTSALKAPAFFRSSKAAGAGAAGCWFLLPKPHSPAACALAGSLELSPSSELPALTGGGVYCAPSCLVFSLCRAAVPGKPGMRQLLRICHLWVDD